MIFSGSESETDHAKENGRIIVDDLDFSFFRDWLPFPGISLEEVRKGRYPLPEFFTQISIQQRGSLNSDCLSDFSGRPCQACPGPLRME